MYLSSSEIRDKFINFFENKGHKHLPSASLVPANDPSVLLTTAGMQQFKPYFFGYEEPPYKRATSCQKCFRTSDLDNVGMTPRHHTFFEMLGNFSFGDYYKKEVIPFAWELITEVFQIDKSKLFVSVFRDDNEAFDIWHNVVGLPIERVVRMGEDDNFWASGETGPCGPCSEIYYDLGPDYGCKKPECNYECGCNRYLEIWNLVFMEFNRTDDGKLIPLPFKNIDTGMGLERMTAVIQNVPNNFETDMYVPIIKAIEEISGQKYGQDNKTDIAFKIIADHTKASIFLINDGVMPSNEGRGYVLRRIMRRAIRYARLLGIEKPFMTELIPTIIKINNHYKELGTKQAFITQIIELEEQRFRDTLEKGMKRLDDIIAQIIDKKENTISGQIAFELYDTYGFPLELTIEIAKEHNLSVDTAEYKKEMEKQRQRAREAGAFTALKDTKVIEGEFPATIFTGYDEAETAATVLGIFPYKDDKFYVILDRTPFYAESGGQIADTGMIKKDALEFNVVNVQKNGDSFIHVIESNGMALNKGDKVTAAIDKNRRAEIKRHHTVTHLLQAALRKVLGSHIEQAGSLVTENYARFDFTHPKAVTSEEISAIENLINEQLLGNTSVCTQVMSLKEAKETGAMALFSEKYADTVRVVKIENLSKELCGGTHVSSIGEIGTCRIISEEAIAAGMRRITLCAGMAGYKWSKELESELKKLALTLKVPVNEVGARITKLSDSNMDLEKELGKLRSEMALCKADSLLDNVSESNGIKYIANIVDVADVQSLRKLTENLAKKIGSGVILLGTKQGEKANITLAVSEDLIAKGINAGNLLKQIAGQCNGKGGGKPNFAQGGGDVDKVENAFDMLKDLLK